MENQATLNIQCQDLQSFLPPPDPLPSREQCQKDPPQISIRYLPKYQTQQNKINMLTSLDKNGNRLHRNKTYSIWQQGPYIRLEHSMILELGHITTLSYLYEIEKKSLYSSKLASFTRTQSYITGKVRNLQNISTVEQIAI